MRAQSAYRAAIKELRSKKMKPAIAGKAACPASGEIKMEEHRQSKVDGVKSYRTLESACASWIILR